MPMPAFVPSLGYRNEAAFISPKTRLAQRVLSVLGGLVLLLSLSVSAFAQAQAQAPNIPGVTSLRIKSDVLGEERLILIRTPQGYEAGNQKYPCST